MSGDYFWQCVALGAKLEGDPRSVYVNFSINVKHAQGFTPDKRAEIRRKLSQIIRGLSQLEKRLAEHEKQSES